MTISQLVRMVPVVGLSIALLGGVAGPVMGQDIAEDMVGQSEEAWTVWQAAMQAIEREEMEKAAGQLQTIAGMDLSDLRLELMGRRTGYLRFEHWAETDDAPGHVKALIEKLKAGKRQRELSEDGWHFAAIGRFKYADANFRALVDSNPDPVALLELARLNDNRHAILIKLLHNTDVGPSAKQFLALLNEGEQLLRIDPYEISVNVAKLMGPPQMAFNATGRLKDSGEYAIPHLIEGLANPEQGELHAAIIRVIPQIGRDALNPLCMALCMDDNVTKAYAIKAMGQIGYRQALPYLAKVAADESQSGEVRAAANEAMAAIGEVGKDVGSMFLALAEDYYNDTSSLKADPRADDGNIWYFRDGKLIFIPVPRAIFNDVMAMRCCEEALNANQNVPGAISLWLAANFRREAKLGMDVESDRPSPLADKDGTRPENNPRAIYFARAAGPKYNHRVLARAFGDGDAGVALGAIAALRDSAGEPNLIGAEDIKQPLVQSLSFPNRQVRIKAALALGSALPKTSFVGAHNVMPVLAEALSASGHRAALIVDPDTASANKLQTALRVAGFDCIIGANLSRAKENAREAGMLTYDVILLASDIAQPDLAGAVSQLRDHFETAATPILNVAKGGQMTKANQVARDAVGVEVLMAEVVDLGDPAIIEERVNSEISQASRSLGMGQLGADASLSLALQAAAVLRDIAEAGTGVFDFSRAVPALIKAMESKSEALRISCAHAMAMASSADAQTAITKSAMDTNHSDEERLAAFGSLAESARHNGNLISKSPLIKDLIEFVMNEQDLVLRAAGSKALGALDLPTNRAGEIIRKQHAG